MAALTTTVPSRAVGGNLAAAGLTAAAESGGDTFLAGSNVWLRVQVTKASPVTVTVTPPAGSGPLGTTITPVALAPAVPATTGDRIFGPFPAVPFADATGKISIDYSPAPSAGDVKVQVLKFAE
jgi:hypothetical protein